MPASVQIVTSLAERITQLFDDAGAVQTERYAALDIARALVPISAASLTDATSQVPGLPESGR